MQKKYETKENEIISEVAKELDFPENTVKSIYLKGLSKFTTYTMKSGTFDSVRWPHFGIFKVKPKVMMIQRYQKGLNKQQRKMFIEYVKSKGYDKAFEADE
jgi:hypothetical protein